MPLAQERHRVVALTLLVIVIASHASAQRHRQFLGGHAILAIARAGALVSCKLAIPRARLAAVIASKRVVQQ